MKKSILVLVSAIFFAANTFAVTVPDAVQKAFANKFPNATNVKWDKENIHEYEASFQWKGEKHSANFSDSGEWLETESTFAFNQLPDKVQAAFNSAHKGATVKAVAKIETSKGLIKYEIEIKQGAKTIELFYTSDGNETK